MYNNEEVGVSGEIAIADTFSVPVSDSYRKRGNIALVESIKPIIKDIFDSENIPRPISHIAEKQNPVDFTLDGGLTLSVKTNQKRLGKVAPQNVGQASSTTFFPFFISIIDPQSIPTSYAGKAQLFKATVFSSIHKLLEVYWSNLFDCDYFIHIYNVLDKNGKISNDPKYIVLSKRESPTWDFNKITFTQTLDTWNESNTVKYDGVTIGEFQIHNNRDNFKFRFNMSGITQLLNEDRI